MASTYASYPYAGGSGGGVSVYSTFSAFPAGTTAGQLAVAADTGILYEWNGAAWVPIGGPGAVLSIGTIDSQTPSANGATINANQLIMQSASATVPGLVNLAAQTFAGVKTLSSAPILSSLTGYLYANGATALTASTAIPTTVLSGTLQAAQFPALTGDVTTTAGSLVTGLVATSNATLTTLSSLSSIGTITTGTWHGTAVGVAYGGTGVNATTTTQNYVFAAPSTGGAGSPTFRALTTADLPAGTGTVTSVGMTVPAFLSVSPPTITTSGTFGITYSGTALPIANGGTSVTSVTTAPTATSFAGWDANKNLSANSLIQGYTTTATAAGTTVLSVGSTEIQYFTGSTTQTVTLPVVTTLANGQQFQIVNLSTGVVTVQTSGANTVQAMAASTNLFLTVANNAGGTGTASWSWEYTGANTATLGVALGGTGLASGTSGGIPYFNTTSTIASSAAITNHGLVVGGGAGGPISSIAAGVAGQILTGTATNPSFSYTPTLGVNATTAGTLGLANGGASGTTITLQNLGNITTGYNFNLPITAGTAGQVLTSQAGGSTSMTWSSVLTNPMTTLGDIIYENATPAPARLAGNTSATLSVLTQTGTGTVSAAPVWTTSTGTGNAVFSASPTLTGTIAAASQTLSGTLAVTGAITPTGGIVGTTAGGNATAGNVGEFVSANSAGVTWATSGAIENIASISLTAGDWDVYATVAFQTGSTSVATYAAAAVSLTSGNFDAGTLGGIWSLTQSFSTASTYYAPLSPRRINISSTTTVYLTGEVSYSTLGGGTWSANSIIQARRVR